MEVFHHVAEFFLFPDEAHVAGLELIFKLADEGVAGSEFFL